MAQPMKILGWVVIGLVLLVALAWIWGWAKLKTRSWAATVQMWQDVQGKIYGSMT